MIYIDTNVFIYANDKGSRFYKNAVSLLKLLASKDLNITTSTEAFQEIVHVAKKLKQVVRGVELCDKILKVIPNPISIDLVIIKKFLKMIKIYPFLESRDLLHLAVCLEKKADSLITEDEKLRRVKGIRCYSIVRALEQYGQNS
ncbi:hypothetical protein A3D00_01680 [Candidatus Woesebacteria bacterium RIFCSPHIGHO2_02_FULL_38_9]|uniref:PIN domain-containing protein n=1 Tax=Candidatus Woesebacteria bacterium RIFCSPHIGHO2_01_FULL_39_28 TaxID=1802496 RepID=A0A1F7YFN7_9BACT|nr:MAG: hypothetical protein A2627_03770 [Candidatus Woesebacteria bacterium RIFCSPHIGHO2_01_FULL_39_28]OGM33638.1 MAG: hypothetical protein A3D00_01680 [Candidatus Woesebacteria bacterium RIFCSPHIGHO2_02_FULL_38_9]OGM58541.1 MAG: hypothetical protein A3A50_00780 [Candidatus Woesebacteria bacterium RIFCSPLOWO2_01_FULL_38_20]